MRQTMLAAVEFRVIAVRAMGPRWADTLPIVPLTKQELETLPKMRFLRDEGVALKQLAKLAGIITALELTREVIREALRRLRHDRAAEATLVAILGGTRYRKYSHGRRLATRCGQCYVREDSFTRMLVC